MFLQTGALAVPQRGQDEFGDWGRELAAGGLWEATPGDVIAARAKPLGTDSGRHG